MENDDAAELWEEVTALRRGFEAVRQRQEATEDLLEDLMRYLFRDPAAALDWAKKLDAIATRRERFDADDASLRWLRTLRDDLLSWHGLAPVVRQAYERGDLHPVPLRERLRVVDGAARTALPDPDVQSLPAPAPPDDQP